MISRVLVPKDISPMAEHVLRYVLEVHSEAEITVLYVFGEPTGMMGATTRLALADDLLQDGGEAPFVAVVEEIADPVVLLEAEPAGHIGDRHGPGFSIRSVGDSRSPPSDSSISHADRYLTAMFQWSSSAPTNQRWSRSGPTAGLITVWNSAIVLSAPPTSYQCRRLTRIESSLSHRRCWCNSLPQ